MRGETYPSDLEDPRTRGKLIVSILEYAGMIPDAFQLFLHLVLDVRYSRCMYI